MLSMVVSKHFPLESFERFALDTLLAVMLKSSAASTQRPRRWRGG